MGQRLIEFVLGRIDRGDDFCFGAHGDSSLHVQATILLLSCIVPNVASRIQPGRKLGNSASHAAMDACLVTSQLKSAIGPTLAAVACRYLSGARRTWRPRIPAEMETTSYNSMVSST